jgi:hypothetical protein
MQVLKLSFVVQSAKALSSILFVTALSLLLSCGGEDDPTPNEVTLAQLTQSPWRISAVTVDNTDRTNLFTNLTLTFTATNYSTTNGGLVWPASGTWTFADESGQKIKRSDGVEITVVEASATTLRLSLQWAKGSLGAGRTGSVAGNHVFTFVRN